VDSKHLKNIPEDMMGLIEMLPRWQEFVKAQQKLAIDEMEMAERVFGRLVREVFKNDPPELYMSRRAKRRAESA
jgi:hypothetical protein